MLSLDDGLGDVEADPLLLTRRGERPQHCRMNSPPSWYSGPRAQGVGAARVRATLAG